MARARNIKPAFFTNEELSEISFFDRLLFIGLWTLTDRRGVLENRPKRIRAELFPYDEVTLDQIVQGLRVLESKGFLYQYESGPSLLIYIENFLKHQHPHKKEKENGFFLPTREDRASTVQDRGQHHTGPEERGKRKEERGKRNEDSEDPALNSQNSDIPIQDPNFKQSPKKTDALEAVEICKLGTTIYKNLQLPHEIHAHVVNILASVSFETFKTAIEKASAASDKNHKYRLSFNKKFPNAESVIGWAESSPQALNSSEGGTTDLGKELKKIIDKKRGKSEPGD